MTLPSYPAYRESGVPWLGSLPVEWDGQALKRVVGRIESGVSVNAVDEPVTTDGIGVLKTSCVYSGRFDPRENKAVIAEEFGRVACPVKANTLIVSRMNTPTLVGAAGLVTADAENLFLPDRLWQVHFTDAIPAFVHYWTTSPLYRAQVERACAGTSASMQNLSQDDFLRFVLPLPSLPEQEAIAAFLDRETAKIDALIAEQEKLIGLLAEKRQATISHAVTHGLDSDAPMKDSGVAWLGKVPAHWEVKRLKTISPFITVGIVVNPSEYVSPEGLPFIYGGDISEGRIDIEGCRRITVEGSARQLKTRLREGDLLTVRVGAPGVTAVVPASCSGGNCASVMLVRKGKFDSDWLCHAMNSRMVRFQVEVVQYGAAQEQFNISHAVNFWIATPPQHEQAQIADHLRDKLGKIEKLSAETLRTTALMRERRAALIAAAVTGQIKVVAD